MYDKDGSGCIDKTELKEIVEVIISHVLSIVNTVRRIYTSTGIIILQWFTRLLKKKKDEKHNSVCSGAEITIS